MTRAEMLQTAEKMVCGHREQDYGSPEDSFTEIGKLWSAYKDVEFDKHDVAVMMALMKIARIKMGKAVEDSYVDGAGYLACAAEIATTKDENSVDETASVGKALVSAVLPKQFRIATDDLMMVEKSVQKLIENNGCISVLEFFMILSNCTWNVHELASADDTFLNLYGWTSPGDFHYKRYGANTVITAVPVAKIRN